jgi:hypothetical protein
MRYSTTKLIIIPVILAFFLFFKIAFPQDSVSPPVTGQFDFWLGKWNTEWTKADKSIGRGVTIVRRKKVDQAMLLKEKFFVEQGEKFPVRSISQYSPRTKKWHQGWNENMGEYIETYWMEGEFKDGKMILLTPLGMKTAPNIVYRMTFSDITKNSFNRVWEVSKDKGTNWELVWRMTYSRIE